MKDQAHTRNRIMYYLSMAIIIIAMVFVSVASYFALKSVTVIVPNVQPYKVITKEIKPGDEFIYEVDSCKYQGVPAVVVRRYVDEKGTRYPQPPESNNIKTGCNKIRVPVATPSTMNPGVWYMDVEISYKVNPLRTENYNFETEKFNVVKE